MDEVSLSRTKSSCVWQWGASLRSKAQGMAKRVAVPKRCCVCRTPGASGSALASPLTLNPSLVNFGREEGGENLGTHQVQTLICVRQN